MRREKGLPSIVRPIGLITMPRAPAGRREVVERGAVQQAFTGCVAIDHALDTNEP
jgi:hypothetical protein